jgi:hypothetical protein
MYIFYLVLNSGSEARSCSLYPVTNHCAIVLPFSLFFCPVTNLRRNLRSGRSNSCKLPLVLAACVKLQVISLSMVAGVPCTGCVGCRWTRRSAYRDNPRLIRHGAHLALQVDHTSSSHQVIVIVFPGDSIRHRSTRPYTPLYSPSILSHHASTRHPPASHASQAAAQHPPSGRGYRRYWRVPSGRLSVRHTGETQPDVQGSPNGDFAGVV